jgi:ribosomal protein L37AE/L43A
MLNNIFPKYSEIIELLKKGATVEAQQKITELRELTIELQEENITLKQEISKLQNQLTRQKSLEWEQPYYWLIEDEKKDGPFCQHCYDTNKKIVRLQGNGGWWECKACKNDYTDKNYKPYTPPAMNTKDPLEGYFNGY